MQHFDGWIATLAARRPFGDDDRLGTANYIDAAARRRGAASVRHGASINLARPLVDSPMPGHEHSFALEVFFRPETGVAADRVELMCHGLVNTHLDGLNHISVDGRFFGGRSLNDPTLSSVADLAAHGLFTRGVVADIPAARGKDVLPVDEPVTGDDIERALAGTTFESGDALLLYMGRDRFETEITTVGPTARPGVGASGAEWIVDNRVSILCWDFLDAGGDEPPMCVHRLIYAIGLLVVDHCDLSEAAALARNTSQRTGALVASPIAVPGGTGCLLTPLLVV